MKENHVSPKLPRETLSLVKSLPFQANSYHFVDLIGTGSYAAVIRCHKKNCHIQFAAKIIFQHNEHDDDESTPNSFNVCNNELKALMTLNHQNIIKLYDSFHHQNHLFMILQLCDKGTMKKKIKNSRGLDQELLIPYMRQLLNAIAFCHQRKIAHRDVKPDNVFMDLYDRPLLADFGFAITVNEKLIKSSCGSYPYRSPENLQAIPHCPFKDDIWALGVTFYEMATGTSPWPTNAPEKIQNAIMSGSYYLPDRIPSVAAQIIRRMLVVDPNKRANAQELLSLPMMTKISSTNLIYTPLINIKPGLSSSMKCLMLNKSELVRNIQIPGKVKRIPISPNKQNSPLLQKSPKELPKTFA